MPSRIRDNDAEYPTWIGFIFVFNLIVGTGALTLPAVFAKAGWLLSLTVIIVLAVMSYMTVTFIVETMACANAIRNWQDLQLLRRHLYNEEVEDKPVGGNSDSDTAILLARAIGQQAQQNELVRNAVVAAESISSSSSTNVDERLERLPLNSQHRPTTTLYYYNLDKKFELGQMAVLFFNDAGRMVFYLCIAIYLYGDMSIYSAAVAKSLRDVLCGAYNASSSLTFNTATLRSYIENKNSSRDDLCWQDHTLSRFDVYRLFLIGYTVLLGPFAMFSVQKTKYIQILTVTFRWLAFTFMIVIATKLIITDGPKGHPAAVQFTGLPSLFGACVYSFMCHHSLPSLLTPIRDKRSLGKLLSYDYFLIATFYILLAMTGIFAFVHLEDLYTLNFIPSSDSDDTPAATVLLVIDYFLALFPVFTLCASYPIIAITLRNNLQTLFLDMTRFETYNIFVRRLLFPMLAVVPPLIITFFTESVTSLVSFTGTYAGAGIQYIIPIVLVYLARNTCEELLGRGLINEFQSPFKSAYWLLFVLIWAIVCVCLVTVNFFFQNS